MERDIQAAAATVEAVMTVHGLNQSDLARHAGIDNGTLGDFLAGRRWPQAKTRGRIEQALTLPPGSIAEAAAGRFRVAVTPPVQTPASSTLPVGSGIDPEVLTRLEGADEVTMEAVRALLRAAQRGD